MRKPLFFFLCALALGGAAQARTVVNPTGVQSSQTVSGLGGPIANATVTLNIMGGLNGDLYAFLSHNGTKAVLLNRVGRDSNSSTGYSDAGFGPDALLNSFTLSDLASYDVHYYRTFPYALNGSGQLTGMWQADGRALDPESAASAFDTAPRSNPLSLFDSMDGNGLWTLFIADVSPLGESTLVSWGLNITLVPEPASATLLCCALATGLLWRLARRVRCGPIPGSS
jgi:hypothetical protein